MKKIVIIGAGAMGSAFTVPCADNRNEVILVGHNPAFTSAANFFSNEEIIHMPTSSIVSISFNEHKWGRVKKGKSFQITRKS